ncbi:LytR C-terminal domain-containing protein [Dietzia sp. 179-F 9C3 NHS]|uniref:LytR C-terminal domain-containing protein n=1 Tax=Dietzia sp. 179-F 9C3 NHS TaxID=3374295 RepID=UPI00387A2538
MSPHPETTQHDPADRHGNADGYDPGEPTGPPYRAIAMVLLAAVVVAIGVGLVQLFGGEDDATTTADQATTSQEGAPAEGRADGDQPAGDPANADGQAPEGGDTVPDEQDPAAVPANGQGGQDGQAPGAAPGAGQASAVPVQVFNNSNVTGLAARTGDTLRNAGFAVEDVANMPSNRGVVPVSTAYYGPGPGEQEAAEAIAAQLGITAEPRPSDLAVDTPGVIVIVTQDLDR